MTKKPKKAAAKSTPKAKSKPPAPKQTAEQLSDKQRQELVLHHRRKMKPLILAAKTASSAMAKGFEIAKKDGITKKDIELAIQLESEEGRAKLQALIQAQLDIDRYTGAHVGTQLELFAKKNSREQNFEDGRIAALDDQPARHPAHLSQQGAKDWLEGHHDGQAQLNIKRAEGFKPLGAVAGAIAGNGADAVDSLSDEDDLNHPGALGEHQEAA